MYLCIEDWRCVWKMCPSMYGRLEMCMEDMFVYGDVSAEMCLWRCVCVLNIGDVFLEVCKGRVSVYRRFEMCLLY